MKRKCRCRGDDGAERASSDYRLFRLGLIHVAPVAGDSTYNTGIIERCTEWAASQGTLGQGAVKRRSAPFASKPVLHVIFSKQVFRLPAQTYSPRFRAAMLHRLLVAFAAGHAAGALPVCRAFPLSPFL